MSGDTASGNRIVWLSVLQGWAMLLVVIGHANFYVFMNGDGGNDSDWLHRFAYAFHMPLFMFVSGGLFYLTRLGKSWRYNDVVVDKLRRLAVPYVMCTLFAFVLKASMSGHMKRGVDWTLSDFVCSFLYPGDGPIAEMWFVSTLFLLMMLYPLYRWVMLRRWTEAAMLLVWAVLLFVELPFPDCVSRLFSLGDVLGYGFYFFAGMLVFKYGLLDKMRNPYVLVVAGLVFAVTYWLWGRVELLTPMVGILMSVSLCMVLSRIFPALFGSFREFTFQIYLVGIYPQMLLELFVWNRISHTWTTLLVCYVVSVVLGLYVPVLVSRMVSRYGGHHVRMCLGLR